MEGILTEKYYFRLGLSHDVVCSVLLLAQGEFSPHLNSHQSQVGKHYMLLESVCSVHSFVLLNILILINDPSVDD